MSIEPTVLYICPNCFSAETSPGECPHCQRERVECDPGKPDNPCRKPPMDKDGRLLSRAPLWWLIRSAPYLRAKLKELR